MLRSGRVTLVGLCASTFALIAANGAGATGACVAGTTPQRACPLTHSVSSSLSGSGDSVYYKLWARRGTEIRLTLDDTENPGCSTGVVPGGCVLMCASFDKLSPSNGKSPCSTPSEGSDRPATEQVTATRSGVFYLSVNTERFNGSGTVPYSLSVSANPGVRWPPPCVVPRLPHDTFLSVAESRLRAAGCRVGQIRRVHNRHTHGGDVVSLGLRGGSIRPRGARVAITVATR